MRLFLVLLSLATLSLASTSSEKEEGCSLSRKKYRKPSGKQIKKSGSPSATTDQSFQTPKKKPARNGKPVLKRRLKKRVGASKGLNKTSDGTDRSSQEDTIAQDDFSKFVLSFFPKVLVELIGKYLDGFSVVFTRNWSASHSWDRVAVDSERHYLITPQDVHASSHSDGKSMSLGSPDLSEYGYFQSSHDGRSLFFTCKSQEQVNSGSLDKIVKWVVQDTDTKGLKSVTFGGGEASFVSYDSVLSADGNTLLSMRINLTLCTWITFVYRVEERGKTVLASKKGDINGYARAVSGNSNRILLKCEEKLEVQDISGDGSNLVLEIRDVEGYVGPCALNSDGSKAAFIVAKRKIYIVDVDKEKGSISVDQLKAIDTPNPDLFYSLRYDAKNRLYAFGSGNLWLVESSKRELVSLEEAQVPQGYTIQSEAVSPNGDYIALLFRLKDEKGGYQLQVIVKGNGKDVLMRLCGYKS